MSYLFRVKITTDICSTLLYTLNFLFCLQSRPGRHYSNCTALVGKTAQLFRDFLSVAFDKLKILGFQLVKADANSGTLALLASTAARLL